MPSKAISETLAAYWRPQLDAWQGSGQTQRAFCRTHDLNYDQFVYWRRKFQGQTANTERRPSSALVPVTYQPVPAESGLSLLLPSGLELRGIASGNLSVVEQLLSRLS